MARRYHEVTVSEMNTSISGVNVGSSKQSGSKMPSRSSNDSARIDRVEKQLALLERDQSAISSLLMSISKGESDEIKVKQNPDQLWACKKCGSRLGFYDHEQDLLRIRYKDFVAYVHLGAGGLIQVLCRQCSEMNEVHYVEVANPTPDVKT